MPPLAAASFVVRRQFHTPLMPAATKRGPCSSVRPCIASRCSASVFFSPSTTTTGSPVSSSQATSTSGEKYSMEPRPGGVRYFRRSFFLPSAPISISGLSRRTRHSRTSAVPGQM